MHRMDWRWMRFEVFTLEELYDLLALRQQVFVVEQKCAYLDADGLDRTAWHLLGRSKGKIVVYIRLIPPGTRYMEPALGRLLTHPSHRVRGLARTAVEKAVAKCRREYPGRGIRISAQTYLTDFYTGLGFSTRGEPYDEDGIPHIEMVNPDGS